jgi:HlyD family secretion protein
MAKKRKKSKVKKRIIQGVVLLALIGGLVWYFLPDAVLVEWDEARIGSLSATVETEAHTRARDRYAVWAPVAGTLQRLPIAVGDPVVVEQTIARLVPDPAALIDPQTAKQLNERMATAEAAKARALAERERVTAALDQARAALRNTEQLAAVGQANALQRDQAQLAVKLAFKDLESAASAVQAAAHDIAAAQTALQQLKQGAALREWTLRAPLSGTVLSVSGASTVSGGVPLIEIGNPRDLDVVAEVNATDAQAIQPGQRAVLTPRGGDGTLEGRVRRVELLAPPAAAPSEEADPEASGPPTAAPAPQRALLLIEFAAPPAKWQSLGDDHAVHARITTATADNVLKVPASAVFADGQQSAVYVIDGSKARKRAVATGLRNADDVVIQSGLKEGERVVLSPSAQIKDGTRVKTR